MLGEGTTQNQHIENVTTSLKNVTLSDVATENVSCSPDNTKESAGDIPASSELQCLYTAPNWYQSHIIDSNSQYIAYGARNMIQILTHDMQPLKMLSTHPKRVSTVCFVDENTLVSGCDGGLVLRWNVEQAEIMSCLLQTPLPITTVISAHGYLFSADDKGFICLWEKLTDTKESRFHPISEKIFTMSCSSHPDKPYLAVGYRLGTIAIMAVAGNNLTLLHTLKGHDSDIFRVCWCYQNSSTYPSLFDNDSARDNIVSISRDKTLRIWDGVNNAFVRSIQYPKKLNTARESHLNKEQPWACTIWTDKGIIATSVTGDLAQLVELSNEEEGISEVKWEAFDTPHCHNKKVFCISDLKDGKLVSTSMDRETILWDNGECIKVAHGLGGFAYGLDISPLSPNRIAVATGDNMVRIWEPFQNKVIQVWQSVRTKVMTVSWHPTREGRLAYGTEEGRVGMYDVNTGSSHVSSTYHDKPVYALCWGFVPTKYEDDELKSGLFSCGGEGNLFCHKPKELNKPAVNVNAYIAAENNYKHMPPGRTSVDWEHKSKLLAVGCNNGLIEIFKAPNLQLIIMLHYHSRIINKLRWGCNEGDEIRLIKSEENGKNETHMINDGTPCQLLLASCSDDNTVSIQDLTHITKSSVPVLQANRSLTGHTARITDVDWNPHDYRYLVSTSYDGTAQVWDVLEGTGISNYRGHAGRLFSTRWSHTNISNIFTGSDEFNVRQWNIEDNAHSVPPETNKLAPAGGASSKRKKKSRAKKNVVISEKKIEKATESEKMDNWRKNMEVETAPEKQHKYAAPETVTVTVGDSKRKKGVRGKSLLPLTSKWDHANRAEQATQIIQIANDLFSDSNNTSDNCNEVGLYSSQKKMFDLIHEERAYHIKENHHHQAALLGIWGSDLAAIVDEAIKTKTVSESLLSFAIMCGFDKYQEAVECYVGQLSQSRDFVTASSYLIILGKIHAAIELLLSEECYREALTIAKLRLSPTDPLIRDIYSKWANKQEREMQIDSAAKCYLACGDPERAILVMLKRKDVVSLQTTLRVAQISKQNQFIPVLTSALEEAKLAEQSVEPVEVQKVDEADTVLPNGS